MGVIQKNKSVIIQFILLMVLLCAWGAAASDTMLMFVGEDLEVLTIASRREEAAWSAPAIADVMTREEIDQKGAVTISQALEDAPGFYMNQTEKGSIPYLRGIPNSALFLFDTMPMGSGIRKSDKRIDYETSLASIKRIEVVRGAGSVLWGPDAFAGIVNAVPMSGKDFQGTKTGLILSSNDAPGEAYLNYGYNSQNWTSFFSVSGRQVLENEESFNVVKFWNGGEEAEPVETRYGQGTAEDSRYINIYGSATYSDWLTFSVKIADSKNAYTVSDWDKEYLWEEQASSTSYTYKLEASRKMGPDSGIRFTGYYSTSDQDHLIVDQSRDLEESSLFGEIIYDRSLFQSKGLFTLGGSWRRDQFDRIPVWDSYYPEYFDEANDSYVLFGKEYPPLLPVANQVDFKNTLASVFGQYRHEFDDIEVWAGARYDDHEEYEDKASYNAGFAWNLGNFIFKSLYGTAYRNPFASQLQETGSNKLEKIQNINAQLSWKNADTHAIVTVFRNEIENHMIENRYLGTGLSTPNSQTIDGVELELAHQLTHNFRLSANLTLLDNTGLNETYLFNDYTLDEIKHYVELDHAYDTGPDTMGSIKGIWQITDQVTLVPELRYFSQRTLYYPVEDTLRVCDDAWIVDVNLRVKQVFPFDLTLYLNNLFDEAYSSPGLYSVITNPGFNAGLMIRMNW